jgi:hypothetical protein
MQVQIAEHQYAVRVEGTWHQPALPGKHHAARIKHTTRVSIEQVDAPVATRWTGEAYCSVADRYSYMRGVRLALERAVTRVAVAQMAPADIALQVYDQYQKAFRQTVLPELAKAEATRKAQRPKVRPVGRRRAVRLATDLALIQAICRDGSRAALQRLPMQVRDETFTLGDVVTILRLGAKLTIVGEVRDD